MSDIELRTIETNGIRMRIAEAGEGPLVVLCHGWPESWYSWRHQLPALAAAGYRAVAPDMRGYGSTDAPAPIESYSIMHLVGDVVGLIDALGADDAVLVGHDWGSIVAWNGALLRPERFRAVVGMSVPFFPRTPLRPTEMFRQMSGDRFFYILYFQEPGKAEAELDPRAAEMMKRMLWSASGDVPKGERAMRDQPNTVGLLDVVLEAPDKLPDWLTEDDLAYYVGEFERTGFRGGINWYRNFDRNWELLAPWAGAKVKVPALFIGGLRDGVVTGPDGEGEGPGVQALPAFCEDLRAKVLLPGIGHWNQQEDPDGTNAALLDFLKDLD